MQCIFPAYSEVFFQGQSFSATAQNNTGPSAVGIVIAFHLPLTDSEDLITNS
jgi:hypothetical protein